MILRSTKTLAVLLAAGAVLVAGGCGGGGDSAPSLTKAQFIKQADAICKKADKVQATALTLAVKKVPANKQTKAIQEKIVVTAGLPPIQREAEEIAALGAPKGDEAKIEAIVTGIEEAVRKTEREPAAILGAVENTPFNEVDSLAAKYGFQACSEAF